MFHQVFEKTDKALSEALDRSAHPMKAATVLCYAAAAFFAASTIAVLVSIL